MKNIIFSVFIIILTSVFSNVWGQVTPITPAVPDNANPSDTNIKMRSAELERIKREADQAKRANYSAINTQAQSKFPQIKEDFEGLQILEASIIKAYTKDKQIDYNLIEVSAADINKRAKRLDANLFAQEVKEKDPSKEEISKEKNEKPKSVRDLIVELDNAIASFVTSPIFGNLKVVDPEVAGKARDDLLLIQEISEKISVEAKKLK